MKRNTLFICLAVLLFLIAAAITVYPLVSNCINDRYQSLVQTDYTEEIENMDYLLVGSVLNLKRAEYQDKFLPSDSIFGTELSYIRRKSMVLHDKKQGYDFAMTQATGYLSDIIRKKNNSHTITYYDSAEKALEAVLQYDAEIAIIDAHITNDADNDTIFLNFINVLL